MFSRCIIPNEILNLIFAYVEKNKVGILFINSIISWKNIYIIIAISKKTKKTKNDSHFIFIIFQDIERYIQRPRFH